MKYILTALLCTSILLPIASHAWFFEQTPLTQGDNNQNVLSLQHVLNILGHTVTEIGKETGYFGSLTTLAIKDLQCSYGIVCNGDSISTGFGVVGRRTSALLQSLFATAGSQSTSNLASLSGSGSGLVAEYTFDNDSGTTTIDAVAGNNGTIFGNPSYTSGKIGSAVSFDGVDDYLLLPASPILPELSDAQFTTSLWVKVSSLGTFRTLLQEKGNVNRGWQLNITAKNQVQFVGYGVTGATGMTAIDSITNTLWHHIVLTRSGTTYAVFVDGNLSPLVTVPTANPAHGTGGLYMGATAATIPSSFASFVADDVRFYDRALSGSEVGTLYTNAGGVAVTPPSTPVPIIVPTPIPTPKPVPVPTPVPIIPKPVPTPTTTPVSVTDKTVLTHNSGGTDFIWEMNCGGKQCKTGTFVNGDYWVVPIDITGQRVRGVTITRIAPDAATNGAEVNPGSKIKLGDTVTTNKQGILPMYDAYDASYDVMTQLPYTAINEQSIFKAFNKTTGCGPATQAKGCVLTDDVLTILNDVPPNNGATVFRPPFESVAKPLFTTDKVKLERLPTIAAINALGGSAASKSMSAIFNQWRVPVYLTAHGASFASEFHRVTAPTAVIDDYAADQALQYTQSMISVFGTDSLAQKKPAVYALLQTGIDDYGPFKLGIPFGSGAGQHLGKKPALTFFAALYDDPRIVAEVRSVATDPTYLNQDFFQEDTQIFRGKNGMVIWGDTSGDYLSDVRRYWSGYFGEWASRNLGGTGYDSKGTSADPYNYIDGPGGGPTPTRPLGRNYQNCCSGGLMINFAFLQHLMPWLEYANGDKEIIEYADRMYNGRNIPGFPGGYWSGYDMCASVDPRESLSCGPYTAAGELQCKYYKVTWGPDPKNPGECIHHNGNPLTDGRWPTLNGAGVSSIGRIAPAVSSLWNKMRDCVDSSKSIYGTGACAGLGAQVPGFTPYNPPLITFSPVSPSPITPVPTPTPKPATTTSPIATTTQPVLSLKAPVLHASDVGLTNVTLAWTTPSGGALAKGYYIYRNAVKIGNTLATLYRDTGLKRDISYLYSVVAYDVQGAISATSNSITISAVTEIPQVITQPTTPTPSTNGGSTATSGGDGITPRTPKKLEEHRTVIEQNGNSSPQTPAHGGSSEIRHKRSLTLSNLNVRALPSAQSAISGIQSIGSSGEIIDGPITAGGRTWWKIDYVQGPDGWSAGDFLSITDSITPTQSTKQNDSNALPANSIIQVGSTVVTLSTLNVRSLPSTKGLLLGQQLQQRTGVVLRGPVLAEGRNWFTINYTSGVDGWSAGEFLSSQSPTPITQITSPTPVPSSLTTPGTGTLSFMNGDTVRTIDNLNVRTLPFKGAQLLGVQPQGTTGTVLSKTSIEAGGYTWWKIDYVQGPDGWSVGSSLVLDTQ